MNKLQLLALVAIFAGVAMQDMEAGCGRKGRNCKPKCEKVAKCEPKVCETTCEDFEEDMCKEECVTFKFTRPYKRTCHNYTTCCTTKKCEKDGWQAQPCELKLICDGQEVEARSV